MELPDLNICFNTDGWGPSLGERVPAFENVPYAQFDKKDKCWRPADFTQAATYVKQYPRHNRRGEDAAVNLEFAYKHDAAEDSTFRLVDTNKSTAKKFTGKRTWPSSQRGGRFGGRHQNQGRTQSREPNTSTAGRGAKSRQPGGQRGGNAGGRMGNKYRNNQNRRMGQNKMDRAPSLTVKGDWEVVEEMDLPQLLKLVANPPKIEKTLLECGHIDQYDELYDKLTSKVARPLRRVENKVFYDVTTQDDPIIEKFAIEGFDKDSNSTGTVFATSGIIAQLMASPRSIYSWDIIVEKTEGMIFLDKRDNSSFDYLTVSETAHEPPLANDDVAEINHPEKLSLEATQINQNFSQQILKEGENEFRKTYEPHPFHDDSNPKEASSVVYRYRRFTLGSVDLVVRCEVHGWTNKRNEDLFLTSYALNEWDSRFCGGIEWRQKIDQQRSAVLATELKNNSCKVAKWTAESILAGADLMKIGYVSRSNRQSNFDHQILATQFFKPKELASQINMAVNNMWGIVKMVCDLLMNQEDGKYVLMKDPNRAVIRLYSVPINSFEDDAEQPAEDGEGKGEGSEDGEEGGI